MTGNARTGWGGRPTIGSGTNSSPPVTWSGSPSWFGESHGDGGRHPPRPLDRGRSHAPVPVPDVRREPWFGHGAAAGRGASAPSGLATPGSSGGRARRRGRRRAGLGDLAAAARPSAGRGDPAGGPGA